MSTTFTSAVCTTPPAGRLSLPAGLPPLDRLTDGELGAVLRTDQRRRWLRGQPAEAAEHRSTWPALADRPRVVLDLLVHEFGLRAELGAAEGPVQFAARYPAYAAALRRRFELAAALLGAAQRHAG